MQYRWKFGGIHTGVIFIQNVFVTGPFPLVWVSGSCEGWPHTILIHSIAFCQFWSKFTNVVLFLIRRELGASRYNGRMGGSDAHGIDVNGTDRVWRTSVLPPLHPPFCQDFHKLMISDLHDDDYIEEWDRLSIGGRWHQSRLRDQQSASWSDENSQNIYEQIFPQLSHQTLKGAVRFFSGQTWDFVPTGMSQLPSPEVGTQKNDDYFTF